MHGASQPPSAASLKAGELACVVAIISGGFSGLMLVVSLARQRRSIVYIHERDEKLRRSLDAAIAALLSSRTTAADFEHQQANAYSASAQVAIRCGIRAD
jgi:hypothetical protein